MRASEICRNMHLRIFFEMKNNLCCEFSHFISAKHLTQVELHFIVLYFDGLNNIVSNPSWEGSH